MRPSPTPTAVSLNALLLPGFEELPLLLLPLPPLLLLFDVGAVLLLVPSNVL